MFVCRGVFTATLEDEEVSTELASPSPPPGSEKETNKQRASVSVVQITGEDAVKPSNTLEE